MSQFTAKKWEDSLDDHWVLLPDGVKNDLSSRPVPKDWKFPKSNLVFLELIKFCKQRKYPEVFEIVAKADVDKVYSGHLAVFGAYAALKTGSESLAREFLDLTKDASPEVRAYLDHLAASLSNQNKFKDDLTKDKGSCSPTGSRFMGCSRKLNSSATKTGQAFSRLRNTNEVMSFPDPFLDSVEIKIINLEHRNDRWAHIKSHLESFGFLNASQYRFEAIGVPGFGELGCTKSHLLAMTEYLCKSEKPFLMILEDDFRFKQSPAEVTKVMSWFVNEKPGDVLMLNCSCAMTSPTEIRIGANQVNRVLSSNSMAGFLVERSHVSKIISVLLDSLASHENMRDIYLALKAAGRREAFRPILNMICNDRVWIKLQTSCRYLTVSPSIGSTIESYSDIESRHVSYSHLENQ